MRWPLNMSDGSTLVVEFDEELDLVMARGDFGNVIVVPSVDACVLGMGLQEASRVAAVARVKREAKQARAALKENGDG